MWHLRESSNLSVNFFKEDVFAYFQKTLDVQMKRIGSARAGSQEQKKNKAEVITPDEGKNLCSSKTLLQLHY